MTAVDDPTWQRVAALYADDARLDAAARNLLSAKFPQPTAEEAAERAMTKALVEAPAVRALANLERSIAEDTVRNEYLLHARIHEWFATGQAPDTLHALNGKVYAELFLTPDSDPWLGLVPPDRTSAIEDEGIVDAR
ncbi:MAG: hypothetical protein ACREIT_05420 [Tepidisphaeraceae bacterium]